MSKTNSKIPEPQMDAPVSETPVNEAVNAADAKSVVSDNGLSASERKELEELRALKSKNSKQKSAMDEQIEKARLEREKIAAENFAATQAKLNPSMAQRQFRREMAIDSDLFRFSLENTVKNVGTKDDPNLQHVPHIHFFRTHDSDGKELLITNSVAGHFHEVTIEQDPNGGPVKIKHISGPKHFVMRKRNGKFRKVTEDLPIFESEDPKFHDRHEHKAQYLESQTVQSRVKNADAAQFMGAEALKASPIPGVAG